MNTKIANLSCVYLTNRDSSSDVTWRKIKHDFVNAECLAVTATWDEIVSTVTTDYFIVITPDTVPDDSFASHAITLPTDYSAWHWPARNYINAAIDPRAGITLRHKSTTAKPALMHDCASTVYLSDTPYQAWHAGFMAGINDCVVDGIRLTQDNYQLQSHDIIGLWHNVGRDVVNGIWAMMGARMATYMTMITPEWDYKLADDADTVKQLFESIASANPELLAGRIAEDLTQVLNLPINMLNPAESDFFKRYYTAARPQLGIMVKQQPTSE